METIYNDRKVRSSGVQIILIQGEDQVNIVFVTDVNMNHEKVAMPKYMDESEEYFFFPLQEYGNLFQEKGLMHKN